MTSVNVNAIVGKTAAIERPLFKVNLCHVYAALPWQIAAILEDSDVLEITSADALGAALNAPVPESIVIAKKSGITEEELQKILKQCAYRKLVYVEMTK